MYLDIYVALYLSRTPRRQEEQCWVHESELREWTETKWGSSPPPLPPSLSHTQTRGHEFGKFKVQYFEALQTQG